MNKKLFSSVIALALVLGSAAALPQSSDIGSISITASAIKSGDWRYELNGNNASITGYSGTDKDIVIPSAIDGHTVTAIGNDAFSRKRITSVKIPDTVTTIEEDAFYFCSELEKVELPESVTEIGEKAFCLCVSLESINLPSKLKVLSKFVLYDCNSLESLTIPSGVTRIEHSALAACDRLNRINIPALVEYIHPQAFYSNRFTAFSVDSKNKNYFVYDGCLYENGSGDLGPSLLFCAGNKSSISILEGASSISDYAFGENISVEQIYIPDSIDKLSGLYFKECYELSSIDIASSNSNYCTFEGNVYTKDMKTLIVCPRKITSLVVPDSVTTIDRFACSTAFDLKAVKLSANTKSIGERAFYYTRSLEDIEIPDGTTLIGKQAFSRSGIKSILLPDTLTTIEYNAFDACTNLTKVLIPSSIETLDETGLGFNSYARDITKIEGFTLYGAAGKAAQIYSLLNDFNYIQIPSYERISGASRYETAVELSKKSYPKGAENVIIVSGASYADALAAAPLAKAYNAPILLTSQAYLNEATAAELKRLDPKKVYFIGGTGVISDNVIQETSTFGVQTQRISGKDRFQTSSNIALELMKTKKPTELYFAYYNDFADALSISSVAAIQNCPILFVQKDGKIDEYTNSFINSAKSTVKNVYVIGGEGVISKNMFNNIKNTVGKTPVRLSGTNRYETCVAVCKAFSSIFKTNDICVATGLNYPDALAGSIFAANKQMPLFLADGVQTGVPEAFLNEKKVNSVYALGGTGAVNTRTLQSILIAST